MKEKYNTKKGFDNLYLYKEAMQVNYLFSPEEYEVPKEMEVPGTVICICAHCKKGWPLDREKLEIYLGEKEKKKEDAPVCPLCGHDTAGDTFSRWDPREYSNEFPWSLGTAQDEGDRFKVSFTSMKMYPVLTRKAVFMKLKPTTEKYILERSGRTYRYCAASPVKVQDHSYRRMVPHCTSFFDEDEDNGADALICREYARWSGRDVKGTEKGNCSCLITTDNRFKENTAMSSDFEHFTRYRNYVFLEGSERRRMVRRFKELTSMQPDALIRKFFPPDFRAPKAVKRMIYKDPLSGHFLGMLYRCGVTDPSVLGNLAGEYGLISENIFHLDMKDVYDSTALAAIYGRKTVEKRYKNEKTGCVAKFTKAYVSAYGQASVQALFRKNSIADLAEVTTIYEEYEDILEKEPFPKKSSLENIEKFFCGIVNSHMFGTEDAIDGQVSGRYQEYDYSKADRDKECTIDGYTFRLPETPQELYLYGSRMHNCAGTYDSRVRGYEHNTSVCRIYELLQDGKPKGCIELSADKNTGMVYLRQAKGMSNSILPKEVFPAFDKWLLENDISTRDDRYGTTINRDYEEALYCWFTGSSTDHTYYGRRAR